VDNSCFFVRRKRIRYAVCRGLLFCPEKSKYYDRDGASAHAIAGLRVLKLKGLGRPSAFRRALPAAAAAAAAAAAMADNESVAVEEMRPADGGILLGETPYTGQGAEI
jgi:hypothetical protein